MARVFLLEGSRSSKNGFHGPKIGLLCNCRVPKLGVLNGRTSRYNRSSKYSCNLRIFNYAGLRWLWVKLKVQPYL